MDDHILTVKSLVNKYVTDRNRSKLYTCFIDFRKAFDTVWHQGVFQKLLEINISGNFLNTLKDMYRKTKCAVKIGSRTTQYFSCEKGVRQGDPLSPLLFNIFINGIFQKLREENCDPATLDGTNLINALAYADDIVLISTTPEGLQKAINITHEYCKTWKLQVNHKKTKCITFTKGTQTEKHKFTIGDEPLENAKTMKYLGITVNKKNCSFTPAIEVLKNKATRALYALRGKINLNEIPIRLALKLFDSLIKPILLYASEVWEPFLNQDASKWDYDVIEKTYLQFLKRILGVNRATTNILVRGELNKHSLQEEILRRNIRYAAYLHKKEDTAFVKQAYNYELSRPSTTTSFTSSINKHFQDLSRMHNEFLPYMNPLENIYQIPEDKLKSYTYQIFHDSWSRSLAESRKGETYRSFKTNMKFDNYLTNINRKHRVLLTKLRISDHKLEIEQGRRTTPTTPRENRLCKFCDTTIENEQHFITECKLYSRTTFFNDITNLYPEFTRLNNNQKFIYLMSQENPEITTNLAKKLQEWFSLRDFILTYFFQPEEQQHQQQQIQQQ